MNDKKITVAGFFSGTGGIELGLNQTGAFETLYATDWDKWVAGTYSLNSSEEHYHLGDVNSINFSALPNVDAIVGGFPCQAFSQAGYRKGFEDDKGRGNLFFRIADAIREKNPEVILLENVKGLVSHDNGNTFRVILETLHSLGYHTQWKVMNAKEYGNIPQGRERIYIVAFKTRNACDRFEFPQPIPLTTSLRDVIDFDHKVDDIFYYSSEKYPSLYPTIENEINEEGVIYQWRRQYVRKNKSGVAPTLTANMGTGGHNVPLIYTQYGIRKLTPRECFNLMGYPASYHLPDQANSHLYKQAGNAVVVPVIKRIGEKIVQALVQ